MITFITSIRHPLNCNSYDEIGRLLSQTLLSVLNQRDQDIRIIVVCNKIPPMFIEDDRVEFIIVDFEPPSTHNGPVTGLAACRRDKGSKYIVGLIHAKQYKPDHIMFFDADDYIHCGIAAYCNARPTEPGWFIDKGYAYRDGGLTYTELDRFNKNCGTSLIFRFDLLDSFIPANLETSSSLAQILAYVDEEFLTKILGAHPFAVDYFATRGHQLKPLPFRGAIYVRGTGENHCLMWVNGRPRLISQQMDDEFCLFLHLSPLRRLRAVLIDYPLELYRQLRYGIIPALKERKRAIA
jgi:hypothetical protein